MTKWTHFWDMHSGGGTKNPPYEQIFIELPQKEAISAFYSRFHSNPHRITCTCCGSDYSITEYDTLQEATSYFRNAEILKDGTEKYRRGYVFGGDDKNKLLTMDELKQRENVLFIYEHEIPEDDTKYEPPEEGWVWQ